MNIHQFHQHLQNAEDDSPYRQLMGVEVSDLVEDPNDGPSSTQSSGSGWWPWNSNDGGSGLIG